MSWRLSTRHMCASKKGLRQKRRTSRGGSMEIRTFDQLLEEAKKRGRKKLAVAFPEEVSLHAALLAHEAGIAAPVLVGIPGKIRELLVQAGADPGLFEIEEAASPAEACAVAVALARDDKVDIILKGGAQTAQMLHAVLDLSLIHIS